MQIYQLYGLGNMVFNTLLYSSFYIHALAPGFPQEGIKKEEFELFLKAIVFAEHAHQGQKRATGEPCIIHPFPVCKILLDYTAEVTTLISSLLHIVTEDTHFSIVSCYKLTKHSQLNVVSVLFLIGNKGMQ